MTTTPTSGDDDEIARLAALMRFLGINRLRTRDGVEIDLGEQPPLAIEVELDAKSEPLDVEPPKKGADGLTAEEQFETYGRVLDAEVR